MSGRPGAPVVLCLVDRPGWAHDRKTDALARELAPAYQVRKRFQAEATAEEIAAADLILLYYWLQVDRLGPLAELLWRRRDRVLVGVCSHFELEGPWREPGLSLLRDLPRAVFANNLGLVCRFEPLLGRPIAYTPNGVDTSFFTPPAARATDGRFRVGWAGSLTNHGREQRGIDALLVPGVSAVAGAELRMAAREEGWRDPEEMRDFYRALDVYVCTSLSEGTPNPCLEAAACGVPVVTTRVGNMPELIRDGENGFFVEREPSSLAATLCRLRDDAALRARIGRCARASVLAWDWRHQARRYGTLFRAVLAGGDLAAAAAATLGDTTPP